MKFKIQSIVPNVIARRRRRQRDQEARKSWPFDLVLLRVQLLYAMAASDGQIVREELEAIDHAIDRAPISVQGRERLREVSRRLALQPPRIELLLEPLAAFREDPPLAHALVNDLVRVAAVDLRADPKEQALLERICDVLGVDPVTIPAPRPEEPVQRRVRRAPGQLDHVSQDRIRDVVRRSLEASYEQGAG